MRPFVLGIALLGIACGASPDPREKSASVSAPIIGGTESGANHDSVVLLSLGDFARCTGTLVAPNLVLTARHCVGATDSCTGGPDFEPSTLAVYTGQLASVMASDPSVAAAKGKQIFTDKTHDYCELDVAFILLDRNVSETVAPLRLGEGAHQDEELTVVGWGLTESGGSPPKRRERSGVRVVAVGPAAALSDSKFMTGESACSGDSGGPALASTGAVVGVVSAGGNGEATGGADACIGPMTDVIYSHLANAQALVDRAFAASGFAVRAEGTPPGLAPGEACEKSVDCAAYACISNVCRMPCTDDTACELDEKCTASGAISVCLVAPKEEVPKRPSTEAAPPPEPPPVVAAATTQDGCSASPFRSRGSSLVALAFLGLALAVRTRRRPFAAAHKGRLWGGPT